MTNEWGCDAGDCSCMFSDGDAVCKIEHMDAIEMNSCFLQAILRMRNVPSSVGLLARDTDPFPRRLCGRQRAGERECDGVPPSWPAVQGRSTSGTQQGSQ